MRVLQVQRFLWLLTPMLTAPILAQGPDSARTLVGWVSDSAATPVTLADVEVVGLGRHAQTDSKGRFRLEKIPTGPTTLRVRRLGFLPITMSVPAVHTEGDSLHVVLLAAAAKLPELKVEAEGGDVFNRAKYADFFRRRTLGIGTFRYGPEIERMHAMHTPELLRDIPGVHLSFGTIAAGVANQFSIRFPRCTGPSHNITVYLDGQRLYGREGQTPEEEAYLLLDTIPPDRVQAIEVFRGVSQIAGEFLDNACAVVSVWTK